jgi:hypothetical protein
VNEWTRREGRADREKLASIDQSKGEDLGDTINRKTDERKLDYRSGQKRGSRDIR